MNTLLLRFTATCGLSTVFKLYNVKIQNDQ